MLSGARAVWVVEDDPAAAALAADLCAANGATACLFRLPLPFLTALRTSLPPSAVVLDWRLEHQLSAALFLATRHRYPRLPVIYWTGSVRSTLPAMIRVPAVTKYSGDTAQNIPIGFGCASVSASG